MPLYSDRDYRATTAMMCPSAPEDLQTLIAKAVRNDPIATERLLLMHYPRLSRYVAGKLPAWIQASVSADDILQETFVEAFRNIVHFRPHSERSFAAWLRAIAENRLRDTIKGHARKKRGGQSRQVRRTTGSQTGSVADLVAVLSANTQTPSRSAARNEAVQAIQVAIAGLPENYREVVQLRYFEGKNIAEIAACVDRSPGSVRGILARAKEKMRAVLGRSSQYLSKR